MDDLPKRKPAGRKISAKPRKSSAGKSTASPGASWSVAQAKSRLSEVIERARTGEPQIITRHGRNAVVIVDAGLWQDMASGKIARRKATLYEALRSSPMVGAKLDMERLDAPLRPLEFK